MAQQGNSDNDDEEDEEEGEIVSHSVECLVGETNATAGIIMPATVLLGGRNHQAANRRVVMDRFEK